ncbi:MAG: protein rep, partial [Hydrogenophilaceae bacterium]
YCSVTARLDRYLIQSASRKACLGSKVTRIRLCLRLRQKGREISVYRSLEHKTCSYGGLQTCGSVWVCAVCAAKISERRRLELQKAIEQHQASGGAVLLLTLTNPHYLGDKLCDVLEGQRKALVIFNKGGDVTRFNQSIGYIGSVRALEVTHGRKRTINNGWHPHYHILLFVQSGLDLDVLRNAFYQRWLKACIKAKMPALPDYKHGLRLDDGSKAAAYASKWGLESEMTKGHIKKANHGETPFDLLRAYAYDDDKQAAALFREFAETFKGKRQLHWSHGLKAKFDLEEVTDEELAAEQDDQAAILGTIELDEWKRILKADVRGEILELARHGWEPVERFLQELKKQYEVKK